MKTRNKEGDPSATNFLEMRVYGLMRSGNHAIIQWIQQQYSGCITCFLNNVKHGDHDPYLNHDDLILTGVNESIDLDPLRKLPKHLLVYSYEDVKNLQANNIDFVSSVFHKDFEENREHYLGTSNHQFDILIIRDPFNCLASRIKLLKERKPFWVVNDLNVVIKNWKI